MKMNPVTVYGPILEGHLMLNEISSGHHEVNTGSGFVRTAIVAQDGVPYILIETENLFGHKMNFCLTPKAANGLHGMLSLKLQEILEYLSSPPENSSVLSAGGEPQP